MRFIGIAAWEDEMFSDINKFLERSTGDILNRDHHTALQSYLLPKDLNQLDYIGRIENMEDVEDRLSQVLDEKITFAWLNRGHRKDYYSTDIDVHRFNDIFEEDYELLKDFYKPFKK
jgi:hypothetical protein